MAVNKLDMVGWSQDRFTDITTRLALFLKQVGFKEQDIFYVPVSGLTGENLTTPPTETKLKEWYTGPSLVQAIGNCILNVFNVSIARIAFIYTGLVIVDGFRTPERSLNQPFRLVISDIFKSTGSSSGCCLAGRIESGMIQTGDKLQIMPLNETANVKGISAHS